MHLRVIPPHHGARHLAVNRLPRGRPDGLFLLPQEAPDLLELHLIPRRSASLYLVCPTHALRWDGTELLRLRWIVACLCSPVIWDYAYYLYMPSLYSVFIVWVVSNCMIHLLSIVWPIWLVGLPGWLAHLSHVLRDISCLQACNICNTPIVPVCSRIPVTISPSSQCSSATEYGAHVLSPLMLFHWVNNWLQQRVTGVHALSIDWMKSYQLPVPCTNCVHLKTHKSGHSVHDCCSAVISNLESSQCSVQWTILFAFAAWCSRGVLEWPLMPYILYTFGFCCHQQDFSLIKVWFYFY